MNIFSQRLPRSKKSAPRAQKLTNTSGDPRGPQPTPHGDRIIFSSGISDPLTKELHSVGTDGQNQTQLTNRVVNLSYQPAISPNGEKIAYVVEKEGRSDLQVMNLDGTGNVNLTDTNKGYWSPSWSPDGKHIVTSSRDNEDDNTELMLLAADGSSKTQITELGFLLNNPVFSPDGSHIVFGLSPGFGATILSSIKLDGSDLKTYARDLNMTGAPRVSPDGDIVFSANRRDGRFGIFKVELGQEGPADVLVDSKYALSPSLSPDGKRLTYIDADDNFDFQIFEANADGTNAHQVTETGTDNSSPVYTADGENLVYLSDKDGKFEVYKQAALDPESSANSSVFHK